VGFPGRDRSSGDPFNSSLNYGYGILYSLAWRSLVLAGLDPYAGFLHVDRSGKPVLAFDYVEMFRVHVVDKPLLAEFRRGYRPRVSDGRLEPRDRRKIASLIVSTLSRRVGGERLEDAVRRYALVRFVVVYDISDNSARARVARTLEAWGLGRVQRSAFVGRMQRARARDLARLLAGMIDGETDVVHIIPVPHHEWSRTIILGTPWGERRVQSAALLY